MPCPRGRPARSGYGKPAGPLDGPGTAKGARWTPGDTTDRQTDGDRQRSTHVGVLVVDGFDQYQANPFLPEKRQMSNTTA